MTPQTRRTAATALLLGAAATATSSAQIMVDAGSADLVFDGQPTTVFGEAVVIVPDLDGDGVRDIAIGELAFDPIDAKGLPINNAGAVAVHSGATGELIRRFEGFERDGNLGASFVVVPDIDGDGVFELAAGVPRLGTTSFEAGGVVLFSGASGTVLGVVDGPFGARTNMGVSMALIGDLNGDGRPEIVAGAPGTGEGSPTSPGHAAILDGATGAVINSVSGTQEGSIFGTSVAGGGDLDNDGTPDFIVGAPLHDAESAGGETYLDAGQIALFSGIDLSLIRPIWHDAGDTESPKANFGTSVAIAGDLDGDGHDDVVAGGPESQQGSGGNGFVATYSGRTGQIIHDIEGAFATGEQHGTWVTAAGDQDGDGVSDFAAGSSQICFGFCSSGPGEMIIYSGATGDQLTVLMGEGLGENFGYRFAFGDLNGDNGIDLVATAPFHGAGGRAYIFMGDAVTPACPADVDGSGDVAFNDIVAVLAAWGPCVGCPEDVSGDDVVAFDDLVSLLAAWGPCP